MKLVVDSGSTKMDWIFLDKGNVVQRFATLGFNPNYSEIQDFENILSLVETQCFASPNHTMQDMETQSIASLQQIHYYGTGCGSEKNCLVIKEVLQKHFPNAEITVTHDLMAACHALLGREKGIACILGTGSNACVYDGQAITERAVSLGYLVGDEGSGMHIGREVVRAYFYGFMPEDLRQQFDEAYHLELSDFIQQLYHIEQPSKYLASFAKFAGEHHDHPFIQELVKACFNAFIEASILRFQDCKSLKISFIGSVAFHFQDILMECIKSHDLTMGEVMTSPAEGLVRYLKA